MSHFLSLMSLLSSHSIPAQFPPDFHILPSLILPHPLCPVPPSLILPHPLCPVPPSLILPHPLCSVPPSLILPHPLCPVLPSLILPHPLCPDPPSLILPHPLCPFPPSLILPHPLCPFPHSLILPHPLCPDPPSYTHLLPPYSAQPLLACSQFPLVSPSRTIIQLSLFILCNSISPISSYLITCMFSLLVECYCQFDERKITPRHEGM